MQKVSPKIYALYLPQYYETSYNNMWWGKGYTDWVATRGAKPLFKGHRQPRRPLGDNYYDLTRVESIVNQAEMAREHGVDGFAIYQYYSCGKKLLEKPTELIRDNPAIQIGYYLFWANEHWRKTWFGQDEEIIWTQEYGDKSDWRSHYEYCRTFFKDERYLKINDMPVYSIYKAWDIKDIKEFMRCWNEWAIEDGFAGIYFVKTLGTNESQSLDGFSATVRREPNYTLAHDQTLFEKFYRISRTILITAINKAILMPRKTGLLMLSVSYDAIWQRILSRPATSAPTFLGAFTDWDSSPRKSYNSLVMKGVSVKKFEYYFSKLYNNAKLSNSAVIVINAWNEWGEGANLEPDCDINYGYLEAIKSITSDVSD